MTYEDRLRALFDMDPSISLGDAMERLRKEDLRVLLPTTVERVRERVQDIENNKDDDEHAHDLEDALYKDVLRAIVAGDVDAPALAKAALEAENIEFSRWRA